MKYYAKSPVFSRDGKFEQTIEMTEDTQGVENQVINIYHLILMDWVRKKYVSGIIIKNEFMNEFVIR